MTALMTPDPASSHVENASGSDSSGTRCVIHAATSAPPASMSAIDRCEVLRRRVPAGHDGELAAMELGVVERQVALDEPDQDEPSTGRHEVERGTHRGLAAGGVEHERRELAAHHPTDDADGVGRGVKDVRARPACRERPPARAHVREPGANPPSEQVGGDREADRTGTDDERALAGLWRPSDHGMPADRQGLDEGELIERQRRRRVQRRARHEQALAHAAIDVRPEDDERLAGVLEPAPARIARSASDRRSDRGSIAGRQARHGGTDLEHLDRELVPEDAGVAEERLPAAEGVEVRAADPDASDADQCLVGARDRRLIDVADLEGAGLDEDRRPHRRRPSDASSAPSSLGGRPNRVT